MTAEQLWTQLDGRRGTLLKKMERYAQLTIPRICPEFGPEENGTEDTDTPLDYQALGAQLVNHLCNKLMLALFRPTVPFFRLRVGKATRNAMSKKGVAEQEFVKALSNLEQEAVRVLEKRAQRPKLYSVMRHLIITGNVLLHIGSSSLRVYGIKRYCVKRNHEGKLHTLVVKECFPFDELQDELQDEVRAAGAQYSADTEVSLYRIVKRQPGGNYTEECWVNHVQIRNAAYNGNYVDERSLPWKALTWDLADEANYGSGLVGDYINDFEATSVLSESVTDGAVLGCEVRWMVNPTGTTSVDDLEDSKNGDALPGKPEDVAPVQTGTSTAVQIADSVLSRYEKRLEQAFLRTTGVIRDAERVTAEEVRRVAQELETAYGGTYSTLGSTLQGPIAEWCLDGIEDGLKDEDLEVIVMTGLDAISRGGDLDKIVQGFTVLGQLTSLPEALQARMRFQRIADDVGAALGVDLGQYLMDDDEFAAEQEKAATARVAEANATAAGEAAAQGTIQQ